MRARSFSLGGLETEPFLRAEYDQRPRRDQNGAQKLAPPPAPCPPTSLCTHEILERERAHACIACTHTNRHACVHAHIQECIQIPAHAVRERVCSCARVRVCACECGVHAVPVNAYQTRPQQYSTPASPSPLVRGRCQLRHALGQRFPLLRLSSRSLAFGRNETPVCKRGRAARDSPFQHFRPVHVRTQGHVSTRVCACVFSCMFV